MLTRLLKLALFLIAAACALVVLSSEAEAAHNQARYSCAYAAAQSATGGIVRYEVRANMHRDLGTDCQDSGGGCETRGTVTDATFCGFDVPAGSPLVFECRSVSSGTVPPSAPTTITVSGYAIDSNQGGGGTPIWTESLASCSSTTNGTTFTHYATSTGAVGGSPRAGIVRLFVRIQNTGIGTTYDCNSDDAGTQAAPSLGTCNTDGLSGSLSGVYRANPGWSSGNLTGTSPCATGCGVYIGGDTITSSVTSNASEYAAAARVKSFVKTDGGAYTQMGTTWTLPIAATTRTTQFVGAAGTWLEGSVMLEWTETGGPTLTGFTGMSYWVFTSATIGNLALVDKNTATFDPTDTFSHTLTEQSHCSPLVLTTPTSVFNRGQTVTSKCRWNDARGTAIPNTEFGRTWIQRLTQYRISTDVGSSDTAFSGGTGELDASNVAATTGTVTTGTAYRFFAESFDLTGRTDASLENWGNSTNQLDLSATYTFDSLLNSKTNGGPNVTSFTISADTENVKALGLRDASANPLNGIDVLCFRTRPDLVAESNVDLGNTNSGGNTGNAAYSVISPAGTWQLTCQVSSNGNTGTYNIHFFFTSAYSADKEDALLWNVDVVDATTLRANITMSISFYDALTDSVECIFPDDLVRLTVRSFNSSSNDYDINEQLRAIMVPGVHPSGALACDWTANFTIPAANLTLGAFAYVSYNFTGSPALASEGYVYDASTGGGDTIIQGGADPLSALCVYSWDTRNATCAMHARFLNGTGRTGIAADMTTRMFHQESGTELGTLPTVEKGPNGTYVMTMTLGTQPYLGTYFFTVQTHQPGSGEIVSASSAFMVAENLTQKIEDLRLLMVSLGQQISYSNSLQNATFNATANLTGYTNGLVNQSSNSTVNVTAYTNSLVNATLAAVQNATSGNAPNVTAAAWAKTAGMFYAGEAVHFAANTTANGSWGALEFVWDFGDNTTGEGPRPHHAYAGAGNYSATVQVFNALGQTASATVNLSVVLSTPHAVISGPTNVSLYNLTLFSAAGSSDAHDEIARYQWDADPTVVHDIPFFGDQESTLGRGTGRDFNYSFPLNENHTIRLTVWNAHGVGNVTTLRVWVHDAIGLADSGSLNPVSADQQIQHATTASTNGFMRTVNFFTRLFTGQW